MCSGSSKMLLWATLSCRCPCSSSCTTPSTHPSIAHCTTRSCMHTCISTTTGRLCPRVATQMQSTSIPSSFSEVSTCTCLRSSSCRVMCCAYTPPRASSSLSPVAASPPSTTRASTAPFSAYPSPTCPYSEYERTTRTMRSRIPIMASTSCCGIGSWVPSGHTRRIRARSRAGASRRRGASCRQSTRTRRTCRWSAPRRRLGERHLNRGCWNSKRYRALQ
mmetsp:Transcript_71658/g.159368  ORF Transcript_71658/g.159368 Transcript_71658/m.159368 type:complete len:220 (+) Transcript_71658:374-1033(+)